MPGDYDHPGSLPKGICQYPSKATGYRVMQDAVSNIDKCRDALNISGNCLNLHLCLLWATTSLSILGLH